MRTIDKILKKIRLPQNIEYELRKQEITNGMGGKGGFRFTDFLRYNIKFFPSYNPKKAKKLFDDMDTISDYHDLDFLLGLGFFAFIIANFKLAYRMYKLFHRTNYLKRIIIFLGVFLATTFKGWEFYNSKDKYLIIKKTCNSH